LPTVIRSLDGGKTWTEVAPAAPDNGLVWTAFFASGESLFVWIQNRQEAYRSSDVGTTWEPFETPVMGPVARDYSAPGAFYVENGGVWRFAE
jgi:photosystem II stability/assembly factor-like uncharacterized protein